MSTKKKAPTEKPRETPRAPLSAGHEDAARTTPMGVTEKEQEERIQGYRDRRAKKNQPAKKAAKEA